MVSATRSATNIVHTNTAIGALRTHALALTNVYASRNDSKPDSGRSNAGCMQQKAEIGKQEARSNCEMRLVGMGGAGGTLGL